LIEICKDKIKLRSGDSFDPSDKNFDADKFISYSLNEINEMWEQIPSASIISSSSTSSLESFSFIERVFLARIQECVRIADSAYENLLFRFLFNLWKYIYLYIFFFFFF
jgi:hypothetical protein